MSGRRTRCVCIAAGFLSCRRGLVGGGLSAVACWGCVGRRAAAAVCGVFVAVTYSLFPAPFPPSSRREEVRVGFACWCAGIRGYVVDEGGRQWWRCDRGTGERNSDDVCGDQRHDSSERRWWWRSRIWRHGDVWRSGSVVILHVVIGCVCGWVSMVHVSTARWSHVGQCKALVRVGLDV